MKEVLKGLFQITAGWTDVRRPYILKVETHGSEIPLNA